MQPRTDRPKYLRVEPNRPKRIARSFAHKPRHKNNYAESGLRPGPVAPLGQESRDESFQEDAPGG